MNSAEQLLHELVTAPAPAPPRPNTLVDPVVVADDIAYVSGQVAFNGNEHPLVGKVGADVTVERAADEAGKAVANGLHRLAQSLGSLDAVEQIMKLTVFVNATDTLTQQPAVANGASQVLHDVLGERGRHARSAVGVASLPLGVPVEVELIAKVRTSHG